MVERQSERERLDVREDPEIEAVTRSVARKRFNPLLNRRPSPRRLRCRRRSTSWTSVLEGIPIRRLRRVISITTIITRWASFIRDSRDTLITLRTRSGQPGVILATEPRSLRSRDRVSTVQIGRIENGNGAPVHARVRVCALDVLRINR